MLYTKGYFNKLGEQVILGDTTHSLKENTNSPIIFTCMYDIETKILIETYLYILKLQEGVSKDTYFLEWVDSIGSDFKQRCGDILEIYEALTAPYMRSEIALALFINSHRDYIEEDEILMNNLQYELEKLKNSQKENLKTMDHFSDTLKNIVYYFYEPGEDVPDCIRLFATYANMSLTQGTPNGLYEEYDALYCYENVSENGLVQIYLQELWKILNDTLVDNLKEFSLILKRLRLPEVVKRYLVNMILNKKCTALKELILNLEEELNYGIESDSELL